MRHTISGIVFQIAVGRSGQQIICVIAIASGSMGLERPAAGLRCCCKGLYVYGHHLRRCGARLEALGGGWVGAGAEEIQMALGTGFVPVPCGEGSGSTAGTAGLGGAELRLGGVGHLTGSPPSP